MPLRSGHRETRGHDKNRESEKDSEPEPLHVLSSALYSERPELSIRNNAGLAKWLRRLVRKFSHSRPARDWVGGCIAPSFRRRVACMQCFGFHSYP